MKSAHIENNISYDEGPLTHYHKVPIVQPAQSMDHRDI